MVEMANGSIYDRGTLILSLCLYIKVGVPSPTKIILLESCTDKHLLGLLICSENQGI